MPVNYGTADVKCPFYTSETRITLKCEGMFSCNCDFEFKTVEQKCQHKEKYCNTYNFNSCPHYRSLMEKYNLDPDELTGPWIERLLYDYSRY